MPRKNYPKSQPLQKHRQPLTTVHELSSCRQKRRFTTQQQAERGNNQPTTDRPTPVSGNLQMQLVRRLAPYIPLRLLEDEVFLDWHISVTTQNWHR